MRLNHRKDPWPLDVQECPCDVHFLEYLERHGVGGKVIFHFGTGAHHAVGTTCARAEPPNEVLGVTATVEEYQRYMEIIIAEPAIAKFYKALFIDVYTLTPRILPSFDLITLFHLGEFHHPERSAYAPLDDAGLLALALAKLNPDGRLFFYRGSAGFKRAEPLIAGAAARGEIAQVDAYESLLIYSRVA
jgi:hypothetical protein